VLSANLAILACLLAAEPETAAARQSLNIGRIVGIVRNHSAGDVPLGGAPVVLRLRAQGQWALWDETTADEHGQFHFEHLPVGPSFPYSAGASRDDVYYPGPTVELSARHSLAGVDLAVCDAVASPCPLVISDFQITVQAEPGVMRFTESLLIDNPSSRCYAGPPVGKDGAPITLRLSIPEDFQRVTFDEEFYGRRFAVIGGKLATSIPWTPGQRKLSYSYTVPNVERCRTWDRPLDLPCRHVRLCVNGPAAEGAITCNLPAEGSNGTAFINARGELSAGYVIHLELGRLPISWIRPAKWMAPVALVLLIAMVTVLLLGRKRGGASKAAALASGHLRADRSATAGPARRRSPGNRAPRSRGPRARK